MDRPCGGLALLPHRAPTSEHRGFSPRIRFRNRSRDGAIRAMTPQKIITDWLCYYRANLKHFEGMINAQSRSGRPPLHCSRASPGKSWQLSSECQRCDPSRLKQWPVRAESGRTKPWLFVTTELLSGRSGASPTLNNLPMQRALDLSLVFHKAVSGDGIQYVPFGAVRIKQSPGKSEWQARGPCACTKLLVMHSAFHRRCLDIHGRNADCSTPLGPSCVDRPKRWMPSSYTVFTCSLLHVTQRLWPL